MSHKTERARYRFVVKEYSDGTPWIALEPLKGSIGFPGDWFLGFDLPKGSSLNKAEEVADYLDNNLADLTITSSN